MAQEEIVIAEHDRCPICKSKDMVSVQAFKKAEVEIPTGSVPSCGHEIFPLLPPAAVMVKTLVNFKEICVKCGTTYIKKSIVVKAPITTRNISDAQLRELFHGGPR